MQLRAAVPALDPHFKQASNRGLTIAARVGYFAHGIVYGLVGTLALLAALGQSGGGVTGSEGAVQRVGRSDWGEPLLWALAIGLACYSLWNFIRAVFDPEHVGRASKGLLKRIGYGISGITHTFLAVYAFQLAAGLGGSDGGSDRTIARVLQYPGGRIAIAIAGLAVIAFGLSEFFRAIKNDVGREFNGGDLPPGRWNLVCTIARIGLCARGAVFPIIGGSLIVAAIDSNASEAQSFGDALRQIASQPFGTFLLGLVAAGLIAYGIYQLFVARYAHIPRG